MNPKMQTESKSAAPFIVGLLLIGLAAFVWDQWQTATTETPSAPATGPEGAIEAAVQARVKEKLLTPGAAKFAKPELTQVSPIRWRVRGEVDSPNAFGALLHTAYLADVTNDGGAVQVVEWHFAGEPGN